MRSSRSNRPSSDTIYHGNVVIPYVNGVSEKFRRIGNRFNIRIISKTKHTLPGTLVKTGPVRDAQETKQRVQNWSLATAADVADLRKYALRSTHITRAKVCSKIKFSPT